MSADHVEQRIHRVETGLIPNRVLRNQVPPVATLRDRMRHYDVPGISIAVIDNYKLAWARAYGVRRAGQPDPVTTQTLFQAGSMSKALAAVAALRLVEKGALSLDEDLNRFLVSWKVPPNDDWQPRVTLRQLLNHSAGFTVHSFAGFERDQGRPTLLDMLEGRKPANNEPVRVSIIPGTQFHYSSGAYEVLEQLLIDVTGISFPDAMRALVLEPLGMEHSTFEQPLPRNYWGSEATGHVGGGRPLAGQWLVYPQAQGGLWTTPSDLARFATALQRAKATLSGALLSSEMAEQAFLPQVQASGDLGVGLGFFLEGSGESLLFENTGFNEGFASRWKVFCNVGLGAVIMTNWHQRALIDETLRAVAREYSWPDYLPEEPHPVTLGESVLASYAGEYVLTTGFHFRVKQDGGELTVEPCGQPPIPLTPRFGDSFFMQVVNAEIRFERAASGEITGLVFRQEGCHWVAQKKGGSSGS